MENINFLKGNLLKEELFYFNHGFEIEHFANRVNYQEDFHFYQWILHKHLFQGAKIYLESHNEFKRCFIEDILNTLKVEIINQTAAESCDLIIVIDSSDFKVPNITAEKIIFLQTGNLFQKRLMQLLNISDLLFCENNLKSAYHQLKEMNYQILERKEIFPQYRFFDTAMIVYFFLCEFLNKFDKFTVEDYFTSLMNIEQHVRNKGFIDSYGHSYYLVVKRGAYD